MRKIDSEGVRRSFGSLEKLPPRRDSRCLERYTYIILRQIVSPDHGVSVTCELLAGESHRSKMVGPNYAATRLRLGPRLCEVWVWGHSGRLAA